VLDSLGIETRPMYLLWDEVLEFQNRHKVKSPWKKKQWRPDRNLLFVDGELRFPTEEYSKKYFSENYELLRSLALKRVMR